MAKKHLLTLVLIFSFIQGCRQSSSEDNDKIENIGMSSSLIEEDENYMLTKDEAKQTLLKMLDKKYRRFFSEILGYDKDDEDEDAEERMYRDFLEGYPDGKFNYGYEDYVVIETIRKWPPEGIEVDDIVEDDDFEIVEEWECNLKEGLFRNITNVGSTFGRFRKNKNGEWIATIEGGSSSPNPGYRQ